jgi:hypothetical protein
MNNVKGMAGFLLGALFLFAASANATTVRSVSSYGEMVNYTSAGSLGGLTQGTLFADPSNPVDGGAFNEEVLCPFSTGCASPGTDDFELFLETLSALTPGTQITINLGSTVSLGSNFGVGLTTCDPTVSGEYCMATAPTAGCFTDGTSTDGSGNNLVTISLSTAPSCASVPSTLVFSLDEDGNSPTFGQVSTNSGSVPAPEPGSFILLMLGLLSIVGLYGRGYRKQSSCGPSQA